MATTRPTRPTGLLTIEDVCAELGVSRSTFYDWRKKNRGPRAIRLPNGTLRVRRRDLDTWLDKHEEKTR